MKYIRCGHNTYESTTTEAVEINGGVLVIRNIPCYKCDNCDEIHFNGEVVKKLEQITKAVEERAQEITILDYNKAA
ncbi:MAG: YgiT-type zinc finger protein [Lachnospiraceae bacterium]|nr:YgiT-type zinc finger protein [Lachnospiraceae bacterium]